MFSLSQPLTMFGKPRNQPRLAELNPPLVTGYEEAKDDDLQELIKEAKDRNLVVQEAMRRGMGEEKVFTMIAALFKRKGYDHTFVFHGGAFSQLMGKDKVFEFKNDNEVTTQLFLDQIKNRITKDAFDNILPGCCGGNAIYPYYSADCFVDIIQFISGENKQPNANNIKLQLIQAFFASSHPASGNDAAIIYAFLFVFFKSPFTLGFLQAHGKRGDSKYGDEVVARKYNFNVQRFQAIVSSLQSVYNNVVIRGKIKACVNVYLPSDVCELVMDYRFGPRARGLA